MSLLITVSVKGNFKSLETRLKKFKDTNKIMSILDTYGKMGVDLLSAATPVDTGKTASSWSYIIENKKDRYTIRFLNSNVVKDVNIAIILQYGHGTRNGGYVQGRDYINPAVKKAFDAMTEEINKEVRSL